MRFQLLIKGGRVLDPAAGYDAVLDVAIDGGQIVAVERDIPEATAAHLIDAAGQVVLPGLVDLHTHIYPGATYWGIRPDGVAAATGVTTWVDAGSTGAFNLLGMREYLDRTSRVRAFAFLNIASIGLVAPTQELFNLDYCDVNLCVKLARLNAGFVRGIKVRMGAQTSGEHLLEPLQRAIAAATTLEVPVMVHLGAAPPGIDEVLDALRAGDLVTHAFTGHTMRIAAEDGGPRDALRRALDRGVLLDLGHGAGGFSFEVAESLFAAGVRPHVMSTDLHQLSLPGPVFDLPTTLSKGLAFGLSLSEVVQAATDAPARVLGLSGQIGTLRPGARADVALFRIEDEPFTVRDTRKVERTAPQRFRNTLTILNGEPLPAETIPPPAPWM